MEASHLNVLVADDFDLQREVLSAYLRERGERTITAADGQEAWEVLQREPVNVVISDWIMPTLDGLELCRRIRAARLDRYVYVILCTARNTKADLIEGIGAGADDFLAKPVDFAELNVRLRTATRILSLERELAEKNRKLAEANAEIEKDLKAAALVQTSLLPQGPCPLPGVRSAWLFLPSGLLAGDTFGYFPLGGELLGFYQLDVSGHGAPAAMLSVTLSRALLPGEGSPVLREGRVASPPQVISALNERFQDAGGRYFTILYGVLDSARRSVVFAQAGHPHPLHVQPCGQARFVGEGGFPAGMIAGMDYSSQDLALAPGDRLLLYSDGLTDCANPQGEAFGADRLLDWAQQTARLDLDSAVAELKAAIHDWRGAEVFEDDISLLALESA